MNKIEDLIRLLSENKDIVKSFSVECSAPGVLRGFNIEYFNIESTGQQSLIFD